MVRDVHLSQGADKAGTGIAPRFSSPDRNETAISTIASNFAWQGIAKGYGEGWG